MEHFTSTKIMSNFIIELSSLFNIFTKILLVENCDYNRSFSCFIKLSFLAVKTFKMSLYFAIHFSLEVFKVIFFYLKLEFFFSTIYLFSLKLYLKLIILIQNMPYNY